MRVTSNALEGALAPQTSRTQETARTYGSDPKGGAAVAGSGGDSVQISDLSVRIMDAASLDQSHVAGRISTLAAAYARGDYAVDSTALSHALVSHALGGAVDGET
jgi:anti-sigma28 factor (negative regulator of flagellin synthesis)